MAYHVDVQAVGLAPDQVRAVGSGRHTLLLPPGVEGHVKLVFSLCNHHAYEWTPGRAFAAAG